MLAQVFVNFNRPAIVFILLSNSIREALELMCMVTVAPCSVEIQGIWATNTGNKQIQAIYKYIQKIQVKILRIPISNSGEIEKGKNRDMTRNQVRVTSLSHCVTKILTPHRMH